MAYSKHSTTAPISTLVRDPFVAAAFAAAERDDDAAFAIPTDRPSIIPGGASCAMREHFERSIDVMIDMLDRLDARVEDLEDGHDDEPYLAGFGVCAGTSTDDRELDDAESGIGDEDGLAEQLSGLYNLCAV